MDCLNIYCEEKKNKPYNKNITFDILNIYERNRDKSKISRDKYINELHPSKIARFKESKQSK